MGNIGPLQLVIVLFVMVLPIVCFWRILPRAGVSKYFGLLAFFPFATPILLLILAFKKWPGDENAEGQS